MEWHLEHKWGKNPGQNESTQVRMPHILFSGSYDDKETIPISVMSLKL